MSSAYSVFRSPTSYEGESHPRRFGSMSTTGTLEEANTIPLHRGSYDHGAFSESEIGMEDSGMRELNLNDRSLEDYHSGNRAGQKRRASSPPSEAAREERMQANGSIDLYPRQRLRNSPVVPRFPLNPGSLSSISSLSQRNASYTSSHAFSNASSMTSYNGDHRISPSAQSPAESEPGLVSPYAYNRSQNPSPRGSLSVAHQHGWPDYDIAVRKMSTSDTALHSRQSSISGRMPDYLTCQCCPKKPKKFTSEEELR
jgi:hypothetical protein